MAIKQVSGNVLVVAGVLVLLRILLYWFQNPELTQMQVFCSTWWVVVIGVVIMQAGLIMRQKTAVTHEDRNDANLSD